MSKSNRMNLDQLFAVCMQNRQDVASWREFIDQLRSYTRAYFDTGGWGKSLSAEDAEDAFSLTLQKLSTTQVRQLAIDK